MHREQRIAKLRDCLAATGSALVCAYLFGSVARGEAGPGSDVDVAVLYAEEPVRTLLNPASALQADLEACLNAPVDLVVLSDASPDLVHRILRDGILLFDRDPLARIRFEVAARNAYFDLKPVLDRYRRGSAA